MSPSDTTGSVGALDEIGMADQPSSDIGESDIDETDIGQTVEIDISVRAEQWNGIDDLAGLARRAVTQALGAVAGGLPANGVEISLVFADADFVGALNRQHRGKPGPTNVLSFPASDDFETGVTLLGDVVLAYEVVADEARARNISMRDHVAHLLVHGTLHLFGYDHILESQAQLMEALETRILKALNIADPYTTEPEPTEPEPTEPTELEHQARRARSPK